MSLLRAFSHSGLMILVTALLAGCSPAPRTEVTVQFAPQIAGDSFACQGEYDGMGSGPTGRYRATDFRWFVSDLVLQDTDGRRTQVQLQDADDGLIYQDASHSVALLGQIDGCSQFDRVEHLQLQGVASGHQFTEACFTLGVPYALNHLDATADDTPSPLNIPAMNWFWRGGHKFMKIDGFGEIDAEGHGTAFNFHLGSTRCHNADGVDGSGPGANRPPDAPCEQPNLAEYCFPLAELQAGRVITVDPARIAATTDLGFNTPGTPPGCVGFRNDPECAAILPRIGLPYEINGRTVPAETGVLFQLAAPQ
ncbi:MAG: MbnP family copper-binding protein [Oceanococcaceae bacterium]